MEGGAVVTSPPDRLVNALDAASSGLTVMAGSSRFSPSTAIAPRLAVSTLQAYHGVTATARLLPRAGHDLRLDWNESTVPPSPLVFERLAAVLGSGQLNWYPDPTATALRRRLARYAGRPVSQVVVFNGSDSALDCVARTFVGESDEVLICAPCYDNFRVFVEALGARVQQVLGPDPFRPDTAGLLARIGAATRLIYLCNPNNPTGRLYRPPQIEQVLRALNGGLLIVDEAYFEFSGVTAAGLLDRYDHLVVTRSFSKAFGLAGLRCGYVLTSARVARLLNRVRNGKEVNLLAQVASAAALDDLPHVRAYVREVRRARAWLVRTLRDRGYDVIATPANFVLLRVDDPPRLVARLEALGVRVRDRSQMPQLERCVRVTVGTLDDCRRFVAALARLEASS